MSFQAILSRTAIAAALATLAPLAAHATAFTAPATATFTLSDFIVGLQTGSTPIVVTAPAGGSVVTNAGGQVTAALLPVTSLDVTGTSLNTFAGAGSGLTLTYGTSSVSLTDFSYATSNKTLSFTLTVAGVAGSLSGAFTADTQATTTSFVSGAAPTGAFLASTLKLTSDTSSAIVSGLGMPAYYASLLSGVNFGNVAVNVNAVPEPSTYALIGLGMAGAAVVARRRKQA